MVIWKTKTILEEAAMSVISYLERVQLWLLGQSLRVLLLGWGETQNSRITCLVDNLSPILSPKQP